MTLKDFFNAISNKATEDTKSEISTYNLYKAADKVYENECVSCDFVSVRFDSPVCRTDTHYIHMIVKILPSHPYYRPWFQDWAHRLSQPIYSVTNLPTPEHSAYGYSEDTKIEDIAEQAVKTIVQRVKECEQSIFTLNRIVDRHGLRDKDLTDLWSAVQSLGKFSKHDGDFFLSADNRDALLSPK